MPTIVGDKQTMNVMAEDVAKLEAENLVCFNKWQRPHRETFYLCLTSHDEAVSAKQERDLWARIKQILNGQQAPARDPILTDSGSGGEPSQPVPAPMPDSLF